MQKLGQPSLTPVRKVCSTVKALYTALRKTMLSVFKQQRKFRATKNFETILSSQTFKIVNNFNVQISVPIVAV
jgi:hypothetical protein